MTAVARFTCPCGNWFETSLRLGAGNDFVLALEPEDAGWYINMRSDDDSIVRCPDHRQVTG